MRKFAKAPQQGMALVSVLIGIMIMTILAALGAGKFATEVNEAAAKSTGAYLLYLRGTMLRVLSEHHHTLNKIDTTAAPAGVYPVSPAWATFAGNTTTISVADLKSSGYLPGDFPDMMPLGRSAHIRLVRTGTCPGLDCNINAYIYSCWPIATVRVPIGSDLSTCPAPPAGIEQNSSLVGTVLMSTDGYAGSNSIDASKFIGPLFGIAATDLAIPGIKDGNVVMLASLNSTFFNQFVRQGDTRHIYLNNNLTTQGFVDTKTGLSMTTTHAANSACDMDLMYATSSRGSLIMCQGGAWVEINNHMVSNTYSLASGQTAPAPSCPGSHLTPFYYAAVQQSDISVTGTDIDVRATLSGTVAGTGTVSAAGNVTVTGSFSGTAQSSPSSIIRVSQQASVSSSGLVTITPNGANARAMVITGCRYL